MSRPDRLGGANSPAAPESGTASRGLLIALGVGVIVRLLLLRLPRLWYDEATSGLLGLSVLRGELPVYFFGQPFMGALDGYLAAPLFWLLGVSARTLELVPVLLALASVGLTVRLAHDAFGPRAALFTAVLLAVPPDFLLFWSHEARNHYPLTILLGTLALLLALRAPAARGGRATVLFALLGGILGLAFWTNFLSLVYFPAVALLLLRRGIRPLVPRVLAALPAFALGSLPHWLYGVPHGTAMPPPGRPVGLETVLAHLRFFGRTAWPIVAGVPQNLRDAALGVGLALVLGALYLVAALAALRAVRRAAAPAGAAGLALVALACTNVGIAVVTQYGRGLDDNDPHYLLPLYTALPPLLGWFLAGLSDRRRARVLTAALVLLHAAGALDGSFGNLRPAVAAAERAELAAQLATLEGLERAGLHRLYDSDATGRVFTVLSAGRTIVSNPYEEIRPGFARAVDGAPAAAWWMPRRAPVLEAHFAALGLRFAFRRVSPLGGVYDGFALVAPPVREVAVRALRVTASDGSGDTGRMTDRIGATLWSTGHPQRGGEWIQVDLGAVVPVALVRWLPGTYQEVPRGLRLEGSLDGLAWRPLVDLPEYGGPLYVSAGRPLQRVRSGRVELRVAPTAARHLRITQTGRGALWAWTIRELYVYAATGGAATPAVEADGAGAGARPEGRGRAAPLRRPRLGEPRRPCRSRDPGSTRQPPAGRLRLHGIGHDADPALSLGRRHRSPAGVRRRRSLRRGGPRGRAGVRPAESRRALALRARPGPPAGAAPLDARARRGRRAAAKACPPRGRRGSRDAVGHGAPARGGRLVPRGSPGGLDRFAACGSRRTIPPTCRRSWSWRARPTACAGSASTRRGGRSTGIDGAASESSTTAPSPSGSSSRRSP